MRLHSFYNDYYRLIINDEVANIEISYHNTEGAEKDMLDQYEAIITIEELQEILNIGRNTAYTLLKNGAIPALRVGKKWKIPKDAVVYYLGQWKKKIK